MASNPEMEQLAQEIRAKRQYTEAEDGTFFCKLGGCPGSSGLRCRRTDVPICQKCAVRTPVGYISKEAARAQEDQFFDAESSDYFIAAIAAFFANLVIGFLVTRIGFFLPGFFGLILLFFLATPAAGAISEIVWRVLRKKRGRHTGRVVAGAALASSILLLPVTPLLILLVYTLVVFTTINARFQLGIKL